MSLLSARLPASFGELAGPARRPASLSPRRRTTAVFCICSRCGDCRNRNIESTAPEPSRNFTPDLALFRISFAARLTPIVLRRPHEIAERLHWHNIGAIYGLKTRRRAGVMLELIEGEPR